MSESELATAISLIFLFRDVSKMSNARRTSTPFSRSLSFFALHFKQGFASLIFRFPAFMTSVFGFMRFRLHLRI